MFQDSNFDMLEFYPPSQGMNRNISKDTLPQVFAYQFENLLSEPVNEAKVRFGNNQITDVPLINNLDYEILGAFDFHKANGEEQIALYIRYFQDYNNASNLLALSNDSFSFTQLQNQSLEIDVPIKITYRSPSGLTTTKGIIKSIEDNLFGGKTLTLRDGILQENLNPGFFIQINHTTLTRVADNRISFSPKPNGSFNSSFNPATHPGVRIRLNIDGNVTTHAIQSFDATNPVSFFITTALNDIPAFNTNVNTVVLSYESFVPEIISFAISNGRIVIYDANTKSLIPNVGIDNLHVGVVPGSITFVGYLALYNGVDRNYKWDGTTFEEIYDFVKEQAAAFNRIDATHFSFTGNAAFDITKYQNNAVVRLVVNGATSTLDITNVAVAGNTVTLTTQQNVPVFTGQNRVELFYKDYPPPFSYMHVAHDRIWALGPGASGIKYRDPEYALRVYYSYRTNTITDWFNENTKTVPSIDISSKHDVYDNLEAIKSYNGLLVFLGRKKSQVWSGEDPINLQSPNAFSFAGLFPIGIANGSLIIELPNDTYFVSEGGEISSFGTLNVARQFATTSVDAVNPLARKYVASIMEDNQAYRACRSFKYNAGAFCGFKIGFNPVLIGLYSVNIYSWSLFSGDFTFASTFLSTLDDGLYLFIDEFIFQYADGISTPPFYADRGGRDAIKWIWTPSLIEFQGRKFANNYYYIELSYPSSFALDTNNNIAISIDGDVRETFSLESDYPSQLRGDIFETVPLLSQAAPDPNDPDASEFGLRFDSPYERVFERLKFVSSKFGITLSGQTRDGLVRFKKLKLYGKIERG
jgi:hypothetical protein